MFAAETQRDGGFQPGGTAVTRMLVLAIAAVSLAGSADA